MERVRCIYRIDRGIYQMLMYPKTTTATTTTHHLDLRYLTDSANSKEDDIHKARLLIPLVSILINFWSFSLPRQRITSGSG